MRRVSTIFLSALIFALLFAVASAARAAPAAARPWYADSLESLGFTVFPKPVAIDDFSAPALSGGTGRLSDAKGKVILLNFWATWCPPCRAEMPAIERLWQKTKDKAFTVMGVSLGEETTTVRSFIAENKYSYPIYLDGSGAIGASFGARSIPTTYVIDKEGRAIAGVVGGIAYDSPEALRLFTALAAK